MSGQVAVEQASRATANGTHAPGPLVESRNFSLWYGAHRALKNVSLTVREHRVTAIIGPSGCGKSTFLKSMNRMAELAPRVRTEGEIFVLGQNVYDRSVNPVELRSTIGLIFQKPNPFPKSIFDNVAFGPRLRGVRDRRQLQEMVESSLRQVGLWDEVKDRLRDSALGLSGGQQQRLCIARALIVKPRLLLMDEPASSLDPVSTAKLEELIRRLKHEYTIVIVTHNMQQAARVADETAFLLNGEVIEHAGTEQIFTRPADARTEDYINGRFG